MRIESCLLSLALILTACNGGMESEGDISDPSVSIPPTPDTPPTDAPPTDAPPTDAPPTDAPPTGNANSAPTITTTMISGHEKETMAARIEATDADDDAITFALKDGPAWMELSSAGDVSGHPMSSSVGTFDILVQASDGMDSAISEIAVEIAYDPVEQALRTGDYTIILNETDLTIVEAMKEDFAQAETQSRRDINTLFQLDSDGQADSQSLTNLTWALSKQATLMRPAFGTSAPLLYANADKDGQSLSEPFSSVAIGRYEQTRFGVLGDNPFRLAALDPDGVSDDMHQLMQNTIAWLIGANPAEELIVVISNMPETSVYPDQTTTREWLTERYGDAVDFNAAGVCDGSELWTCVTEETSLIIVSQHPSSTATTGDVKLQLQWALEDGIPVLFLTGYDRINTLGGEIMDLLGVDVARRNGIETTVSNFSPVGQFTNWQPESISAFETLIDRVEQNQASYTLAECTQYWDCPENPAFAAEIATPLKNLRSELGDLNNRPGGAFPANQGLRWQGYALLVGDYYRSLTTYPMSVFDTTSRDMIRAMIGDATAIIGRDMNPAANLGWFGPSEYPAHLRTNKSITLTPQSPFRTTGVYAFPGETVTVTRTDESDVAVRLKVHSIRDNANAPFRGTYERPLFLSSRFLTIEPGETLTFTSAFGGPVHAYFGTSDQDITLDFENIGEHPIWRGPEDTSTFLDALNSSDFEWAEFVTPYFEVHSQRSKLRQTLFRPYASSPSDLSDMIDTYIRSWPHWLAGREGPGISPNPDLRAFAVSNGLTIPVVDSIKHMNADRPACTASAPNCSGTSGNPYDANWFFDPIYLGDLHELGHGLEYRARHHFEGGDSTHSTTNLYAFHTQYRYYSETGDTNFVCWSLPHRSLYSTIQSSLQRSDPAQYMRDQNLSNFSQQMTIFVQLFAALENQGALADGWQLMPRLNLVTREFQNARNDDLWATKSDGLGFAGMDRAAANSLSQNDWLLIALSWSAQRDLRDYLDMWGYLYSDAALDQVAQMNLPPLSPAYYAIDSRGHCFGFDYPDLPIDSGTSWPTRSATSKVAAFTPDYLQSAVHEHNAMCALGDHAEAPN